MQHFGEVQFRFGIDLPDLVLCSIPLSDYFFLQEGRIQDGIRNERKRLWCAFVKVGRLVHDSLA